ncbi:MAG: hypothetical protein JW751_04070 [Polyangiaceae bacterium]|nr:hypothetical protein [Polyangiaceae bacterium]
MMPSPEVSSNENVSSALQNLIDAAVRLVDAIPGTFAEREQALLGALQEAGRVGLEHDLQRMEEALPDKIAVGDERRAYGVHQPGTAVYLSLFGELRVQRRNYREVGGCNGPTLVAAKLLAGMIEGATCPQPRERPRCAGQREPADLERYPQARQEDRRRVVEGHQARYRRTIHHQPLRSAGRLPR